MVGVHNDYYIINALAPVTNEKQANAGSRSESVKHKPLIDAELTANTQDTQSLPTIFPEFPLKRTRAPLLLLSVFHSFSFWTEMGLRFIKWKKQTNKKANI